MLELHGINAGYGRVQVLWDLSLSVRRGEIVALVGANAAGKSTVLKTAQGLVRPFSGTARFLDEDVHRMASHHVVARGLSLVHEDRMLFRTMTVMENLQMGAFPKRGRRAFSETLAWVYELFPILKLRADQKVHTLSGGEQQMLAIGRALMAKPVLLMLDEPSLGLAPLVTAELFRTIRSINVQGITILLVEQNLEQSLRTAHRAYVLEAGRVVREGSGEKLLNDPGIREAYLGL